MKKILVTMILVLITCMYFAQTSRSVEQSARAGFERAQRVQIGEQEAISAEAFKPKTDVIIPKLETNVRPVYSKFNQKVVRSTNRILLNKWLKESK